VKLLNSFILTFEVTFELIAMPEGYMSVSVSLRKQPSLIGLFFSHSFSFLFASFSASLRRFSSSLKVKIKSSLGILNGFSLNVLEAAVSSR